MLEMGKVDECLEFHSKFPTLVVGVNHYKLAEWILKTVPVATVLETGEILTYHNGMYIPNGKQYIHKILVAALTPFTRATGGTVYNDHIFREVLNIIRG